METLNSKTSIYGYARVAGHENLFSSMKMTGTVVRKR
jgi:hypothetical protein